MKYVSIDIETTGLDFEKCSILEFAAIVDDLNVQAPLETLPKYQTYILQDYYNGEAYALAMHGDKFKKIANWMACDADIEVCSPARLLNSFHTFLVTFGYRDFAKNGPIKINVAGKDFANFDKRFLEKLPGYNEMVKINHRILDPVMLYFNPKEDTEQLPSMTACLKRAGLEGEVPHTALEDAAIVIKLIRKKYPL